jgi:ABC-type glycerol-3-phosphate transport system substrate-binding protein
VNAVRLSRRTCLSLFATSSFVGLLAACGGSATVTTAGTAASSSIATAASVASATSAATTAPTSTAAQSAATTTSATVAASSTAASTSATVASSSTASAAATANAATPTPVPVVIKQGFTEVRVWVHWGGQSKDLLQKQVIDPYNNGQGAQDKIQVVVESKDDNKWQEEMTLAKVSGDPPEIYHSWISSKVMATNQLVDPLPADEQTYVKQNYYPGAGDRLTFQGKVYGYPTEFQPLGYVYRKSYFRDSGITAPPKTVEEELDIAMKTTRQSGGQQQRIGFVIYTSRLPQNLAGYIKRWGGDMYSFDGDHPTKINVATPQAIDAVSFWKKFMDSGATEGKTSPSNAWKQELAVAMEIEVWFPLGTLLNAGKTDTWDDLGATAVPPHQGVQPVTYFYGYGLLPASGTKHPDERLTVLKAFTHKPAMPWSHFIVETIGSAPAPLNYPTPISRWTPDITQGYAIDAPKIALANPEEKVLGADQISAAYTKTLTDIWANTVSVQSGLSALESQLNSILKQTDP